MRSRFRRFLPWLFLLAALVCLGFAIWHFWPHRVAPPPTKAGWPPDLEAKRQTESERGLVYAGIPRPSQKDPTLLVLRNTGYVAGYSESREDPLWVGYSLEGPPKGPGGKRPSKFETDVRTQSRVRHDEFTSTGYDRGHLAPNAGIAGRLGFAAQKETFLLTNIVPMTPDLNRRVWEKLERLESDAWAPRFGKVWVLTGPCSMTAGNCWEKRTIATRAVRASKFPTRSTRSSSTKTVQRCGSCRSSFPSMSAEPKHRASSSLASTGSNSSRVSTSCGRSTTLTKTPSRKPRLQISGNIFHFRFFRR